MPSRVAPVVASGAVVVLALPVFLVAGWPLAAWALAAVVWGAAQLLGLLLGRLPVGASNLASSGVVGIGMSFRAIAVAVPLIAVAVANAEVGVAAALTYALAYTLELGVGLASYFAGEPRS
jgi:hypothetical protein